MDLEQQLAEARAEIARLKAAVEVARRFGEHYPTCDRMPSTLKFASPEARAWMKEHRHSGRAYCDCWKSKMEAALTGSDQLSDRRDTKGT